jgi:hypothetical protein
MEIKTWHPEMTLEETKDLGYFERNALALHYADGWYNDLVHVSQTVHEGEVPDFKAALVPRYLGWTRVLTLDGGKITFHIPDDFDVGDLPLVAPNWDGHTTEEKWRRILEMRGVK